MTDARFNDQWAAGFFQGESCIGLYPNGRRCYSPKLEIAQNSPETLRIVQRLYGGHVNQTTEREHRWTTRAKQNVHLTLLQVRPYLAGDKRIQADLLIQYLAGHAAGEDIAAALKKAKRPWLT